MLTDVVVHISNEQPLLADLLAEPKPSDVAPICKDIRLTNGKKPVFVEAPTRHSLSRWLTFASSRYRTPGAGFAWAASPTPSKRDRAARRVAAQRAAKWLMLDSRR